MILQYDSYRTDDEIRDEFDNLLETLIAEANLTDEQAIKTIHIVTGLCRYCLNRYDCYCSPAYDI
jgi:hypothetical protein